MRNLCSKVNAIYFVAGTFALLTCGVSIVSYYTGFFHSVEFLNVIVLSLSVLSILVIILSRKVISMNKEIETKKNKLAQKEQELTNIKQQPKDKEKELENKIASEKKATKQNKELIAQLTKKKQNAEKIILELYNKCTKLAGPSIHEELCQTLKKSTTFKDKVEYIKFQLNSFFHTNEFLIRDLKIMEKNYDETFTMKEELKRVLQEKEKRLKEEEEENKKLQDSLVLSGKIREENKEMHLILKKKMDDLGEKEKFIAKLEEHHINRYKKLYEEKEELSVKLNKEVSKVEDLERELNMLRDEANISEKEIYDTKKELLQKKQELATTKKQLDDSDSESYHNSCELSKQGKINSIMYNKHKNELLCEIRKLQEKENGMLCIGDMVEKVTVFLINELGEFMKQNMKNEMTNEKAKEMKLYITRKCLECFSYEGGELSISLPTQYIIEEPSFTQNVTALSTPFQRRS